MLEKVASSAMQCIALSAHDVQQLRMTRKNENLVMIRVNIFLRINPGYKKIDGEKCADTAPRLILETDLFAAPSRIRSGSPLVFQDRNTVEANHAAAPKPREAG